MTDYDNEIWQLVPENAGPPPAHLIEFIEGLPHAREALDLGCGDGRLTAAVPADHVVGADPSWVALERARKRLPDARLVPIGADERLIFADGQFDLVVCAETLEHVRDVQNLVSEARRVLAPGGTFAVTTPANGRLTALRIVLAGWNGYFDPLAPHIRFFTAGSLRNLLTTMGFEVESIRRRSGSLLATARREKTG